MKQSKQNDGRRRSILLVDDDQVTRLFLSIVFKQKNYTVLEAMNGKEAFSIYKSQMPDLLLTDICMPEMDGIELTVKIHELNPNMPIIVMSTEESKLQQAEGVGANMTFLKPVRKHVVLDAVNALIQVSNINQTVMDRVRRFDI